MSAELSTLDQLTLDHLPDDVLVLVMQHLGVEDLLACRLVCKRLGGLALHPDAWRHRRLDVDKPCLCAVLSLAPCLDKIVYSREVHTRLFTTTSCAVRHLSLHINRASECLSSSLVVRNQEALGRLRSVQLQVPPSYSIWRLPIGSTALLKTLLECSSGLESLDLPSGLPWPLGERLALPGPPKPSLKHFRCELSEKVEPLVTTVLSGHAATLEDVDLGEGYGGSADMAALLASMPRLRKLKCEVFPGMEALAARKTLVDLSISTLSQLSEDSDESDIDGEAVEGAAKLLRRADQLVAVSIGLAGDIDFEDMMGAMASSARPLVERLSLTSFCEEMQPLLRALPQFPALRVLSLSGTVLFDYDYAEEMDQLLLGITPDTAPTLRLLELSAYEPEGCVHSWLHRDSLRSVLTSNPLLHVHVLEPRACNDHIICEECAAACHQHETLLTVARLGLFSHDPNDCPRPENHIISSRWLWIHTK